MNIITYINSKRGEPLIDNLSQISDQEFRQYTTMRAKELDEAKRLLKPKKERKVRIDKEKKRPKYDSSLSIKHRNYLGRANAKGLPFELTAVEFDALCKGICIYCGDPATGVDRRDNKKGYTVSNSQPCCYTCNHMKCALPEYVFIERLETIIRRWYQRQQ